MIQTVAASRESADQRPQFQFQANAFPPRRICVNGTERPVYALAIPSHLILGEGVVGKLYRFLPIFTAYRLSSSLAVAPLALLGTFWRQFCAARAEREAVEAWNG
jgi:hypothetical protein